MQNVRTPKLLNAGAFVAAVTASICCFGPLVLAVLGLGGGVLLLKLEPYRPYSLGAAALFLGAAFYLAYRRQPSQECAPDSDCALASDRRGQRIALWIVASIVVLAATFPYYSKWLF